MKPNFIQFANAFFKIVHHRWGLIPYQGIKHHIELSQHFEDHPGVLCKKYRCGGFTTFCALWCLWKAITHEQWKAIIVSNWDRCSLYVSSILRTAYDNLPPEIKLETETFNDHELTLENDSCIRCLSHSNLLGKGTRQDVIIFDEPAFYRNNDLEAHYKAVFPMTSDGGKMFLVSTPNGKQGYFYELYKTALLSKDSRFYVYAPSYLESHEYSSERMHLLDESLGHRGLLQEYLGEFREIEPYM